MCIDNGIFLYMLGATCIDPDGQGGLREAGAIHKLCVLWMFN